MILTQSGSTAFFAGRFQWGAERGTSGVDQSFLRVQSYPSAINASFGRMPVAVFFNKTEI